MTESIRERYARHKATQSMEVRLASAQDRVRGLLVATFAETWHSSGGVHYRRTGVARQIAYARYHAALALLAEDVLGVMPETLDRDLYNEALALGELVFDGRRPAYPPHEQDASWVASLHVRSTP